MMLRLAVVVFFYHGCSSSIWRDFGGVIERGESGAAFGGA